MLSLHRVYTLSHRKRIVPFPCGETARPASSPSLSRFVRHSLILRQEKIHQRIIFLIGRQNEQTAGFSVDGTDFDRPASSR